MGGLKSGLGNMGSGITKGVGNLGTGVKKGYSKTVGATLGFVGLGH